MGQQSEISVAKEKTKRTKLRDRVLPNYTFGDEIFNMVSHIVGSVFAVVVLFVCLYRAVSTGNVWGVVSGAIFGLAMVFMYVMSSIYHGLRTDISKKVFQIIDHCSIFLLIAGSYTVIVLGSPMRSTYPVAAWLILGLVWGLAVLGIVLNAIDLYKYRRFSMLCYVGTGWSVLLVINPLLNSVPLPAVLLLLVGGIAYSVGSVLYSVGKRVKHMHPVFHLMVLAGSITHSLAVILYVL